MNKDEVQKTINEHKAYLSETYSVEKIGLLGSFVRDEQTENSDIDLLVEFKKPVGFEFIELKEYLEAKTSRSGNRKCPKTIHEGTSDE
ncbi:nucleotidyltransferase family protein [Cohnella herbarum]|uniref:nucleotidyltransferase family protein n=1 Tax=Cohnella herbarum TaxID=2728023 RepID=UPI0020C434AD|nr:nucleotidyltransferase domain-containing protein [Cohnella herbarum]